MHIIYVINQHHCDEIKDYLKFDHQIKKHLYFQYIKTWLHGYLFLLVTRLKNCLCYHVFIHDVLLHAHVYNNENNKLLNLVHLNISNTFLWSDYTCL